jgi:hypothetical protein
MLKVNSQGGEELLVGGGMNESSYEETPRIERVFKKCAQ